MKTSIEAKREIRFYVCLIMAYTLMMISLFLPPLNIITSSVLYASIIILSLGGMAVGVDLQGILREIRLMKNNVGNDMQEERKRDEETD